MNTFTFANFIGYTDVKPVEVIRHVTDRCVEVRHMKAESAPEFKPNIIPGGFSGHCTNNTEGGQKWIITQDETNPIFKIRLHKNGTWRDANDGSYIPSDHARKFYDYNF